MSFATRDAGHADHRQGFARRDFFKTMGLGAAGLTLAPWAALAGPFTTADKKLPPAWVASLFAPGTATMYSGAALEKIGMPVGGLCAGQLYLGGDGKLWHWDIFNQPVSTADAHYAHPLAPTSPLDQGFALRLTAGGRTTVRALDRTGWRDISFTGEYPIGRVTYRDADAPVDVALEAFSPFIPLETEDSALPATVLEFTLKNRSQETVEAELAGWLENAVCRYSGHGRAGQRRNHVGRRENVLLFECVAEALVEDSSLRRPDIVFEDFEKESYGNWTATGAAFGQGPVEMAKMPDYQGQVVGQGRRVVNSHASAPGGGVGEKDAAIGSLTSPPFLVERNYITFLIGGGAHAGRTCFELLVEGQAVLSATGANDNRMQPRSWDVRQWAGKQARLRLVDNETGGWGNLGLDDIIFSDIPRTPLTPLVDEADYGSLGLALLAPRADDAAWPGAAGGVFGAVGLPPAAAAARPFGEKLVGSLVRKLELGPGRSATVTFVLAWHFPNLRLDRLPGGRHYATRFKSAGAVARYVADHFPRLSGQTRLWHDTWYGSTLPHWLLERTFLNTSILATSTCHWLADGRFYAWEGVGCCAGTCGHVWQYAHALARLFPDLERVTRERVDFGLALQPNGAIFFRGEFNDFPAVDGQAGAILRAYREHQMSADDAFLRRVWPRVKRALEYLIAEDGDRDGVLEGRQHNTLDTDWYGPVAWLSGLYLAALRAGEQMAREAGDTEFAAQAETIARRGAQRLVEVCWNGEYFMNRADPRRPDTINSGTGCHIDQVFGQSWAFQVGLERVLPVTPTRRALASLWRYNFMLNVGPFRAANKPGRWYAMPGEPGLVMCTFPRADWDYQRAKGTGADWAAGYFNECMNGFEYQVAAHMLWEGMPLEGLAVTRAVHDRYHATRRNPWNEVECGDHYARSMASYGVFLAACGYEYHGPKGHLGFAPRLAPANFRAAFTAAEGWGVFTQTRAGREQKEQIEVRWGKLRLRTLAFELAPTHSVRRAKLVAGGRPVAATFRQEGARVLLTLERELTLQTGQRLEVLLL